MKKLHYFLLGAVVCLCLAAASPSLPPTRIAPGSNVTVTTNGVNNFTIAATGGVADGGSLTNVNIYVQTNKGTIYFSADNTYDIGLQADLRPRDIFLSRNLLGGAWISVGAGSAYYGGAGRSSLSSSLDGWWLLANNSGSGFGVLQFGGTTAAYPGISLANGLAARTASDSAYTNFTAKNIYLQAGTSTNILKAEALLYFTTTATTNVGGGEDTLWTQSVEGGTLAADGDTIPFELTGGYGASVGDNKYLKLKWGGTEFWGLTNATALDAFWEVKGRIIRTGAATQRITGSFLSGNGASVVTTAFSVTGSATLSSANTFLVTGESDTASDGMIYIHAGQLGYKPAR